MSALLFGLQKVEIGDPESDGSMGTSLTEVGETVSGTAQFVGADPTVTNIPIEESDTPLLSLSKKGEDTYSWSSYNMDGAQLAKILGGTFTPQSGTDPDIVPAQYDAPLDSVAIYKSVKITDKKGNVIQIPKANITAKFNAVFTGDKVAQVDIKATVNTPDKANLAPYSIIYVTT